MNEIDKAYVAGLIDGEGSVCLTRLHKNTRRAPVVSFPNTDATLIQAFHILCGGSVVSKKAYNSRHAASQEVKVTYNAALNLLREILPFLRHSEKRRRAELLLAEYKDATPRNGKYTPELIRRREDFERRFFLKNGPTSEEVGP